MIKVQRPPLDEKGLSLVQKGGIARQALIDHFEKQIQPQIDSKLYQCYKSYLLDAFHNKCAYCECVISSSQPGDVEHFRPKNRVTDSGLKPIKVHYPAWGETEHMGYFWLAYDWDNLLPSCADCNRYRKHPDGRGYGKADRFPISGYRAFLPDSEGNEDPLLIDPTQVDPNDHFTFLPDGLMKAKTKKGEETIELLGLNKRELLVRDRKHEYRSAWRVLINYIQEAAGDDDVQIEELRREVNGIWVGEYRHTAYGREAIEELRRRYAARNWPLPMPIPPVPAP